MAAVVGRGDNDSPYAVLVEQIARAVAFRHPGPRVIRCGDRTRRPGVVTDEKLLFSVLVRHREHLGAQ